MIPYVNRSTRLQGDGIALVEELAEIAQAAGGHAEVLAASFRSLREVADALLAGADHVTISSDLLHAMGDHGLSDQAIVEFAEAMG